MSKGPTVKNPPAEPKAGAGARQPWVGRPLPRFEDERLVAGLGHFTDDFSMPGEVHAVFLRAGRAHADILRLDVTAACAVTGVLAVLTADDYRADGMQSLPTFAVPAGALNADEPVFVPTDEFPIVDTLQWPIAHARVRFPGEIVAMIIAENVQAARDGAEAIAVEYSDLPAITGFADGLAPGAPVLWPDLPGQDKQPNIAVDNEFGDEARTSAALAASHLVVEQAFENKRVSVSFMEPRGGIASYDEKTGRFTLVSGSQGVHRIRMTLAKTLNIDMQKLRVISPDTGGGFGSRNDAYPEQALVIWAAKKVGRPVKWINDRTESFLCDYHGRDMLTRVRMGFDANGAITAYALDIMGNIGAQTISFVQMHNHYRVAPTVYRVPVAHLRVRALMTNTVPTGPFRGAGRPEATLAMERCLDIAAGRLGMDRIELRRRNLIRKSDLPYLTATGLTYDSGDFTGNMKKALVASDWKGFAARHRAASRRGRLVGIGLANYVETPVGAPIERVDIRIEREHVELAIGTHSTGQGHETSFAQVIADLFGVTPFDVKVIYGDTDKIASGGGSHSDRSMRLGSALMVQASVAIIAQARAIAAFLLEVEETAITFEDGLFGAGERNRKLSIFDIADAIENNAALPQALRVKLQSTASMRGRISAYPTGCAICEVEIDPQTGALEITRYTAFDDAGQPINPLILHGQVHGGAVQAIGQALGEAVAYDSGNGQVMSASFMDYPMPRADSVPTFNVHIVEDPVRDPAKRNPLRIKGGGEGGSTPGLAVVMNAVCHALGVEHMDMPASPQNVWRALKSSAGQ